MRELLKKINWKIEDTLSGQNERKVDFIICGAQKGGTTALDTYLRQHPDICMARIKEVHFFDKEEFFSDSTVDYSKYHASFHPKKKHKLVGEATPVYMYWDEAPHRIWEYNPYMKLIILLRNPIDRAYSHWNMQRSRNIDPLSFWDAIQNEEERCRKAAPYKHRLYSYVDRGFYLSQLEKIWNIFPKENVLIMKSEYLKKQQIHALRDVCMFLGIDEFQKIEVKNVHSRSYQSKMSDQEKSYLKHIFRDEIHNLEKALGWDCSDWFSK